MQQFMNKVIEIKQMKILIIIICSFCIVVSYGCSDKDTTSFSKKSCNKIKKASKSIKSIVHIKTPKIQLSEKHEMSVGNTNKIEQLLKAFNPVINQVNESKKDKPNKQKSEKLTIPEIRKKINGLNDIAAPIFCVKCLNEQLNDDLNGLLTIFEETLNRNLNDWLRSELHRLIARIYRKWGDNEKAIQIYENDIKELNSKKNKYIDKDKAGMFAIVLEKKNDYYGLRAILKEQRNNYDENTYYQKLNEYDRNIYELRHQTIVLKKLLNKPPDVILLVEEKERKKEVQDAVDYYKKLSVNKKQEFIENNQKRIENIRLSYEHRKMREDILARIEQID